MAAPAIAAGAFRLAMKLTPWILGTVIVDKVTDKIPTPQDPESAPAQNVNSPVANGYKTGFTLGKLATYTVIGAGAYFAYNKISRGR